MEQGHVCPTSTIRCPVDATKFWRCVPNHYLTQTSFQGHHLSGVWRVENLKVLSWGCRVDVVTPSIQVVWWLSELWCWPEALCYFAEATFCTGCQAEHVGKASSFFQLVDICVWVNCHSCLHHIKENHSFTVPEHRDHHCSADGEHQGAVLYLFLHHSLPSDLHCSNGLQHFHIHCWVTYGYSSLFLSLQQGTLSQHVVCNDYHWHTPFWRAAAEVSCGGNLCEFIHGMREVQMCTTWKTAS